MHSKSLEPWLDKLAKHTLLNEEQRAALLNLPLRKATVDAETYLVRDGDKARQCCVLLTGFAYRSRTTDKGARQILAISMRGDAVDLQNSMMRIADHSVKTLTQAEVAYIPHPLLLDVIAKHPKVAEALWRQTLVDGSIANEWILNVGARAGRERVSHLICEIAFLQKAAGLTQGPQYPWPLTQNHMGDATGLSNVHVNRVLQGLRNEGLIILNNHVLTIPNWDALREAAGFSTAYLHQDRLVA